MLTLSPSSMNLLNTCEQKFAHYKVYETPYDLDYIKNSEGADIGSTIHRTLELFKWKYDPKATGIILNQLNKYELMDKYLLVLAMYKKLCEFHKLSRLKIIHIELSIEKDKFLGYADLIVRDAKKWYILDLKNKHPAFWTDKQRALLPRDVQLSLYAKHYTDIANALELDSDRFGGCIYRVATKPQIKQGAKEKDEKYLERLIERVNVEDVYIPVENMEIGTLWGEYETAYDRYLELKNGESPKRNYANCIQYNKACEYFSNCHGINFSDASKKIKVKTFKSLKETNI